MLVLSRRINEAIRIGNSTVRVLQIRGGQVSLGIEAQKEIPVMRTELDERMRQREAGAREEITTF